MSFYTRENTRGEPFYKLPQLLFKDENLKKLSSDAKILYAIMQNRVTLSEENRWVDEDDRVYIYLTIEEIQELINCKDQKAQKVINELKEIGMISVERQGLNKPNKIYVKMLISENHYSGLVKITNQDKWKSLTSKNDISKNNISKNNNYYNNNIYYPEDKECRCCSEYLNKINPVASSLEIERLTSWLDEVDDELIVEAINIAVLNNAKRFNYINGILNNWLEQGITNTTQLKALEKIKKEEKKNKDGLTRENKRNEKLEELIGKHSITI